MSGNFMKNFFRMFNIIFDDKATRELTKREIFFKAGILGSFVAGHGFYAYLTGKHDTITVTKKYKMTRGGYTDFMVVDNKGRHFNVNNSFWYWKWNSIEDWYKIEEKKGLLITYYGWRIAPLGLFPNIVISDTV